MTYYDSVVLQIAVMLNIPESEAKRYEVCINSSIEYVRNMLDNEKSLDDSRIINLCAAHSALKIALMKEANGEAVTSFTAGDVSYKTGTSSVERLKLLFEVSFNECRGMMKNDGFSFRVV